MPRVASTDCHRSRSGKSVTSRSVRDGVKREIGIRPLEPYFHEEVKAQWLGVEEVVICRAYGRNCRVASGRFRTVTHTLLDRDQGPTYGSRIAEFSLAVLAGATSTNQKRQTLTHVDSFCQVE